MQCVFKMPPVIILLTLAQPPNSYFTLYPRTPAGTATGTPAGGSSTALKNASTPSLIARYSLEDRLGTTEAIAEGEVGGKANWESTPEAREASLKERKAKMILAARQCVSAFQMFERCSVLMLFLDECLLLRRKLPPHHDTFTHHFFKLSGNTSHLSSPTTTTISLHHSASQQLPSSSRF